MRKARLLVAALTAAVGALAATAGPAGAAIIVVNPGQSIQAAVDVANPGDTILVRPGTYYQEVVIQKDRIRLQGTLAAIRPPLVDTSPCGQIGICVVGNIDFNTGEIFGYVHGVTVTGFTVSGFGDSGIFAYAADRTTFSNNTSFSNAAYGLVAFTTTYTTMAGNVARDNGEAGLYVGDSTVANASVHDNASQANTFGILFRNSSVGTLRHNTITHNCGGIIVLADSPGPASNVNVLSNTVSGNTAACDSEDVGPVSGIGIALFGANHVLVQGNTVRDNTPSDATIAQGGVIVETGPGGTPAHANTITGNTILHNSPDIFWDGLGHNNVFKPNTCQTSIPSGLC
jgi:nitrous oxidase accessory protein NosD